MKRFYLFIYFLFTQFAICQELKVDSLLNEEFTVLEEKFNNTLLDSLRIKYAYAFLLRAKQNKDSLKIAEGYSLFSEFYSQTNKAIQYTDSIIYISKYWNDKKYPAQGYIQKGIQLYYNSDYTLAFENFMKANTIAFKKIIIYSLL